MYAHERYSVKLFLKAPGSLSLFFAASWGNAVVLKLLKGISKSSVSFRGMAYLATPSGPIKDPIKKVSALFSRFVVASVARVYLIRLNNFFISSMVLKRMWRGFVLRDKSTTVSSAAVNNK